MISDKIYLYCQNAGITVARFEKLCGLGNGSVGKWRKLHTFPSMKSLMKLEKGTGIPAYMWLEEEGL